MDEFNNEVQGGETGETPERTENSGIAEPQADLAAPDEMRSEQPEMPPVQNVPGTNPYIQNNSPYMPGYTPVQYGQPQGGNPYAQNQNTYQPVQYTPVTDVKDNKPASKGLKVFALAMALVVLLTGVCVTGYFFGRNSISVATGKKVDVNLAAKPAKTDEMTPQQVYAVADESIVGIYVYNLEGDGAQASGVFYTDDGYVVTNDHIYSEVSSPLFKVFTSDGKEYDAKYVAGDIVSDLAVLKVEGKGFKPATFGDSSQLVCGENVVAIGRPSAAAEASSITKGIISVPSRRVQTTSSYSARLIQTDSAINPGSSGGALVNMYGQVVGITSSKLAGVEYDAVGYAIPTTIMKRIVEELIKDGKVISRAKLGITYTAVDSVAAQIKGYSNTGLYIASVSDDSDLFGKVGEGDIITHINGIEIVRDRIVLDAIEESRAGDKITLTIVSAGGASADYTVTLKANVGQSSYTTEKIPDDEKPSGDSSGGSFDFPDGE